MTETRLGTQGGPDLEVYYPTNNSMFNGCHKSLNRNFYVDMTKQSLPLDIFERTMKHGVTPDKHIDIQPSLVERDIVTTLRDMAASTMSRFFPSNVLCMGTLPLYELKKWEPGAWEACQCGGLDYRTNIHYRMLACDTHDMAHKFCDWHDICLWHGRLVSGIGSEGRV